MKNKSTILYVLPNLFTAASMYIGVLSIIYAINEKFILACWLIVLAMIFDGLDGRVARLTGTTSKFGAELDSLADIVSFGVAPAIIMFLYTGQDYGKFGVLAAALFVIFGAIRLARFNVSSINQEPSVFIGFPIPAAALVLISWILLIENHPIFKPLSFALLILSFLVAAVMVSNIRYPSFKKISFEKKDKKRILIAIILLLSLIYLYPEFVLTALITSYFLFGIIRGSYYFIFKILLKK